MISVNPIWTGKLRSWCEFFTGFPILVYELVILMTLLSVRHRAHHTPKLREPPPQHPLHIGPVPAAGRAGAAEVAAAPPPEPQPSPQHIVEGPLPLTPPAPLHSPGGVVTTLQSPGPGVRPSSLPPSRTPGDLEGNICAVYTLLVFISLGVCTENWGSGWLLLLVVLVFARPETFFFCFLSTYESLLDISYSPLTFRE